MNSRIFPLKNRKAFDFINKDGISAKSRFFIIVGKKIPAENIHSLLSLPVDISNRRGLNKNVKFLGMKVSKKIGKAVDRNFVKRRLRSLFHDFCKKIDFHDNSFGFIIIPHRLILKAKYSEIATNFEYLLKKML